MCHYLFLLLYMGKYECEFLDVDSRTMLKWILKIGINKRNLIDSIEDAVYHLAHVAVALNL